MHNMEDLKRALFGLVRQELDLKKKLQRPYTSFFYQPTLSYFILPQITTASPTLSYPSLPVRLPALPSPTAIPCGGG